jgi:hypothetical protein
MQVICEWSFICINTLLTNVRENRRMDNPEKLATMDTQDTRLKTNKTKRDEMVTSTC